MVRKPDAFSDYDAILTTGSDLVPWNLEPGNRVFVPDYALLERLLAVPIAAKSTSQSGRHARAIDAWVAQEFRRAGFEEESIWPRAKQPRVLSHDLVYLLSKLPVKEREQLERRLDSASAITPTDARILGRAYEKQVDVVMSRWNSGPQLLLSTKTQVASFAKNLPNRFEEAYGDAGNLRARYPLAAVGFLFVQRSTILDDDAPAFERTIDMMRKLRDRGDENGYTATSLMLVEWADDGSSVTVRDDEVPEDLHAGQMFTSLIETILTSTPISEHVAARQSYEGRVLAVDQDPVLDPDVDHLADGQ